MKPRPQQSDLVSRATTGCKCDILWHRRVRLCESYFNAGEIFVVKMSFFVDLNALLGIFSLHIKFYKTRNIERTNRFS